MNTQNRFLIIADRHYIKTLKVPVNEKHTIIVNFLFRNENSILYWLLHL